MRPKLFSAVFVTLLCCLGPLVTLAMDPPSQDWDPVGVIDASELVVVVNRTGVLGQKTLYYEPNDIVGVLLKLDVVRPLTEMPDLEKTIWVFRPSWDGNDQFDFDQKFILFLRKMTREEVAYVSGARDFNGGKEIWTLASLWEHWMSYYPLEAGSRPMQRSLLKKMLLSVGVGGDGGRDPEEYLKSLVELRRQSKLYPTSPPPSADRFQQEVINPDSTPQAIKKSILRDFAKSFVKPVKRSPSAQEIPNPEFRQSNQSLQTPAAKP